MCPYSWAALLWPEFYESHTCIKYMLLEIVIFGEFFSTHYICAINSNRVFRLELVHSSFNIKHDHCCVKGTLYTLKTLIALL
jgi:hypothetical protein